MSSVHPHCIVYNQCRCSKTRTWWWGRCWMLSKCRQSCCYRCGSRGTVHGRSREYRRRRSAHHECHTWQRSGSLRLSPQTQLSCCCGCCCCRSNPTAPSNSTNRQNSISTSQYTAKSATATSVYHLNSVSRLPNAPQWTQLNCHFLPITRVFASQATTTSNKFFSAVGP